MDTHKSYSTVGTMWNIRRIVVNGIRGYEGRKRRCQYEGRRLQDREREPGSQGEEKATLQIELVQKREEG